MRYPVEGATVRRMHTTYSIRLDKRVELNKILWYSRNCSCDPPPYCRINPKTNIEDIIPHMFDIHFIGC